MNNDKHLIDEAMAWDFEYLQRQIEGNKQAGTLVETKTGKLGRTFNSDPTPNGKTLVYLCDGTRLACDPSGLTLKGFID